MMAHLRSWLSDFWPHILILIASLMSVWQLFASPYFPMHDDMQPIRVMDMASCLTDLQIPCRISSNMNYGYFYPVFNYYGPLPYYLISTLHLLGLDLLLVIKIGFALSLVVGNIGFFYLARHFTNPVNSVIVTLLYAYMPYRLSDIYSRGAYGEAWAFAIIPFIALFGFRLVATQSFKSIVLFGVTIAMLIASHNISTLIFLPLIVFTLLIYSFIYHYPYREIFTRIFLSGLVAFGLSAFFLLPVVFEKSLVHVESMISGYFDYRMHFLSFSQMFFSTLWGYGSSEIGPLDDLSFFYSPLSFVFLISALFLSIRHLTSKRVIVGLFAVAVFLFASFMAHQKSSFVWSALPLLHFLQFPWRFLVVGNFFLLLSLIFLLPQKTPKRSLVLIFVSILMLLVFHGQLATPQRSINHTTQTKLSGKSFDRQMTMSIFDYLPKSATLPPGSVAPYLPVFSVPSTLSDFERTSRSLSFSYYSESDTQVTLPMIYYPKLIVRIDGQSLDYRVLDTTGIVVLDLPAGSHQVSVYITDTLIRFVANLITFSSLILLFLIYPRLDRKSAKHV
jgi:hypothetical protein